MAKADTPANSGISRAKVDERSPYQRWLEKLDIEADLHGVGETDFIVDEILSAVIDAADLNDAFEAAKKTIESGKTLVDVEIRVNEVTIHHTSLPSARFKYIARVEGVRLDTAEEIKFNVGAPNVVALLWKSREADVLPIEVVIRGRDLGEGKILLNLERVPKRAA